MYFEGNSYQTIANIFNEENVGNKKWRDNTIYEIIENPIYKGDYIHGKRTSHPTYYENVIEPIVSKEMWDSCQVQQKKNSRNYMRIKEYIFLQKIKCPKCGRIMGGKATYKKKNDTIYYYYGCEKCKNNIKEDRVENSMITLLSDILEYDSVVNEFFLPMLKGKVENPKEELSKELKVQEMKKERVRNAYINDAFTLEEYKKETEIIESNIKLLEEKILETNTIDKLKFTKEDILIKRDIDFINKIKLPNLYKEIVVGWNDLTREEKSKIIMNYIEDITIKQIDNGNYVVDTVNFRSTFFKDLTSLYEEGYIDWKMPKLDYDGYSYVRYSNYLPQEKVEQHIMRLREFYEVYYYEGVFDFETKRFNGKKYENTEIVRMFPLEKLEENKNQINMGMISVKKDNITFVSNEEELFTTIPEIVNEDFISQGQQSCSFQSLTSNEIIT